MVSMRSWLRSSCCSLSTHCWEPQSIRRWRRLAIAGTVTALSSVPAVFTLSGVVPALASKGEIRRDTAALRRLALNGAWLAGSARPELFPDVPARRRKSVHAEVLDPLLPDSARGWQQSGFLIGTAFTEFFLALGGVWRVPAALLFLVPLIAWSEFGSGRHQGGIEGTRRSDFRSRPLSLEHRCSGSIPSPHDSCCSAPRPQSSCLPQPGLDDLAGSVIRAHPEVPWLALGWLRQFSSSLSWMTRAVSSITPRAQTIWRPLITELEARTINQEPRSMFSPASVPGVALLHHGLEALAGHRTGPALSADLVSSGGPRLPACAEPERPGRRLREMTWYFVTGTGRVDRGTDGNGTRRTRHERETDRIPVGPKTK